MTILAAGNVGIGTAAPNPWNWGGARSFSVASGATNADTNIDIAATDALVLLDYCLVVALCQVHAWLLYVQALRVNDKGWINVF